ncbi:MAG: glycosyltransferase family 2 protein [Vampirovibrionales bacterium]|nr:glycosyltransferase family 2 protein [Vampirovibrionales bacterium]
MSAPSAPLTHPKRISILIPVYNEVQFLRQLLAKVDGTNFCGLEKEIILVDDGSTDGTRDILSALQKERPDYNVIFHEKNQGKGAALRTALTHVGGEIVIIQDADLEYDPKDYPPLVQALLDGQADVVYGSRLSSGESDAGFGTLHYFGNKFLTLITNLLYQTTLTDMETCYKAFRAEVITPVRIRSDRFDFEPEITAKVLKRGYHLKEMPISYLGRAANEGKKITWKDGIWAIWALVKFRFID